MAYSADEKQNIVNNICDLITDGDSLRKACEEIGTSLKVFYQWINDDEIKSNQYAQACQNRADKLAEEILSISDQNFTDVQRDRLRVDSRKWIASKMYPKKYGDRLISDHNINPKEINGITFEDDKD